MQRPPLWACGPLLPPLPPFPIPYMCAGHEAQDRTGQPPPLPLFTHNGERTPPLPPSRMRAKEARDRYAPPFVPVPVHVEQETRTPPLPPPLTRERGAAQEVTRHPRLHTTGTRQPPPPFVHTRTGHANAGQAPAAAAAAPICAQGGVGHRNEVHGTGRGMAWDKARAPPPFPSCRGPCAQCQRRRGAPPALRAEAMHTRGPCAGMRTGPPPTPSAPRPRLHARAARERGRALQVGVRPRVRAHGQCANRNAQRQRPLHDTGASEPGGHAGAKRERAHARQRPPPSPSSRARAKRERVAAWKHPPPSPACSRARAKRERATTRKPPLSRGFARKGKTRAGDHAEAPPLPRVRAQGRNATAWRKRPLLCVCRGAQVGWCVTGRRANARRAVTWWHPTLGFAHRGSTCMCAAPVRKAEEPRLPGS
ncbi:hypothetical protein EDB89DRAFT_1915877 [Lactarius sanguifluus]|nr:hypothetical protein EDB89DRAFT_1915877 [Lactarius sanguifluus]